MDAALASVVACSFGLGCFGLGRPFTLSSIGISAMHIKWRGLELPSNVQLDHHTLSPTYGKFIAEPFERGFGTTVGNSLRRVLLSSLEGSAITQIKIRGAQHEFTTLPRHPRRTLRKSF